MRPILCLVIDRAVARGDLATSVAAAVRGGVDWVQIRDRELSGAALLDFTDSLSSAAREAAEAKGREIRILVNRRIDVALAAGADGVHLGFDAVDPLTARALMGEEALIGCSTHTPREIIVCGGAASYTHLAPIYEPLSKTSTRPCVGLEGLREATSSDDATVLAQGGINAANARRVCAAGAAGIAVTGAILQALDPERAAEALREALDASVA